MAGGCNYPEPARENCKRRPLEPFEGKPLRFFIGAQLFNPSKKLRYLPNRRKAPFLHLGEHQPAITPHIEHAPVTGNQRDFGVGRVDDLGRHTVSLRAVVSDAAVGDFDFHYRRSRAALPTTSVIH